MSTNILSRLDSLTPSTFALDIENLVRKTKLSYLQAVLHYAECNGIDVLSLPSLINSTLKCKIAVEAEELHLIRKTSKLPL